MDANEAAALVARAHRIRGWFSFEAAMLFAWIDEIQKANGIAGDVFEIGVHHGKSAILLGAMVEPPLESLGVCDLFGDQEKNVSRSGFGKRESFERNMRKLRPGTLEIRVFAKASKDLTVDEIGNKHRFFHIDGGHNPDEVLKDLHLAAESVIRQGVIVLDDPLKPEWPGVSEGLFRFLQEDKHYCALAIGFNKLILVRREFADLYARELDNPEQRSKYKIVFPWDMRIRDFMEYPLRIFCEYPSRNSIRTRLGRLYNRSAFLRSPLLRPVAVIARALFR